MRLTKETRTLECILTDAEKLKYGAEMAELHYKKSRAEDQLKSIQSAIKADIAAHEAKINDLSQKISTGREYREVQCAIVYDWDRKVKSSIRNDTGEIAHEDIIPDRELQEEMDLRKLEEAKQDAGQETIVEEVK